MLIRPYVADDRDAVKALHHEQGLAYELPDLEAPSMLVRAVIEEEGRITHAAFLRKTCEAYWIFSPDERKRDRLGKMLALSKEMLKPAERAGLEDVHAFLPPAIATTSLDRTLLNLGWVKPLWVCYSRKVSS
jgi:hypothetical protein